MVNKFEHVLRVGGGKFVTCYSEVQEYLYGGMGAEAVVIASGIVVTWGSTSVNRQTE